MQNSLAILVRAGRQPACRSGRSACYGPDMILLRHGQSEFNLHFGATRRDPGIVDPRLTELGHTQAGEAACATRGAGHHAHHRLALHPRPADRRPVAAALGLDGDRSTRSCASATPLPATSARRAARWSATGRQHDFSPIEEIWWPEDEEPEASIVDRAARFRSEIAQRHDWAHTLVVSHWGFILSMTGQSVTNGQWLRCDPAEPPPERLIWRA